MTNVDEEEPIKREIAWKISSRYNSCNWMQTLFRSRKELYHYLVKSGRLGYPFIYFYDRPRLGIYFPIPTKINRNRTNKTLFCIIPDDNFENRMLTIIEAECPTLYEKLMNDR